MITSIRGYVVLIDGNLSLSGKGIGPAIYCTRREARAFRRGLRDHGIGYKRTSLSYMHVTFETWLAPKKRKAVK